MAKLTIPSSCYYSLSAVYFSLCLFGFVYQVGLEAMEFFKFDVFKQVNIILPEYYYSNDRVLYVCFHMEEIIDHKKYSDVIANKASAAQGNDPSIGKIIVAKDTTLMKRMFLEKYLTVKQRFEVAPSLSDTESCSDKEYVIGSKTCYSFSCNQSQLTPRHVENVSVIHVSVGDAFTPYDIRRAQKIFLDATKTTIADIKSNTYSGLKLKYPYVDNCYDYKSLGYNDRKDARSHCIKQLSIEKTQMVPKEFIVQISDSNNSNYKINFSSNNTDYNLQCYRRHRYPDCSYQIFLTQVAVGTNPKMSSDVQLNMVLDTDPSLTTRSYPRISHHDFLVYTLTVTCIWLGIFGILFNPIKCCCNPNNSVSDDD